MTKIKSIVKSLLKPLGIGALAIVRVGRLLGLRLSPRVLVSIHLLRSGNPGHPNKKAFIHVLESFDGEPLMILETGTSAWGADSTRLWDEYVRLWGGQVKSVDIRPDPSFQLKGKLSKDTELVIGDSVGYLRRLSETAESFDLIYLDSYDVDWQNPEPAESHGAAEFELAMSLVRTGGIILIDDTPTIEAALHAGIKLQIAEDSGAPVIRGKGAKALSKLESNSNFKIFFHDYAVAIKRIK